MTENLNQPNKDDAVLGGNAPAFSGVVLGGIEGVKWRLGMGESPVQSNSIEQKIAALNDALNYGQAGLDLVIQALEDAEWHIHQAAYSLLTAHSDNNVKQALLQYSSRLAAELLKCYEAGERNFQGVNLSGAYLPWVVLSEANLSKVNLVGGDLSEAYLNGANLSQAYLNKANLSYAELIGANLRGADLSNANLGVTDLSEATLTWTNLSETNLSSANLSGANLVGAKFTNLDLSRADLSGAKLNGVNLNEANLDGAYYNDETDFPIGFRAYSQLIKLPE
jgi:uncharacterized protein YjbI with pentapeptide repeats